MSYGWWANILELAFCCMSGTSVNCIYTVVALHTGLPLTSPFLCQTCCLLLLSTLRLLPGPSPVHERGSPLPVEMCTFQESVVCHHTCLMVLLLLYQVICKKLYVKEQTTLMWKESCFTENCVECLRTT